jgi:murein DD-endopeptidase MepM/ murein hydrolase activator NlpD
MISYGWLVAALALPVAGAGAVIATNLAAPNLTDTIYTVQSGDTLNAIANRYGVTVDELVAANGLANPDRIYVGQALVIPRQNEVTGGQTYTVQIGDTMPAIGLRYGVSVDDILAANSLTSRDQIFAGQVLNIPVSTGAPQATSGDVTYTMQRGDTLYRVSLIFGMSVDDLLAANSLQSPNGVYPGLVIRIPVGQQVAPVPEVGAPPDPAVPTGGRTYVVHMGDTLTGIAVTTGVTVDGIIAANGLNNPDSIYVGQTLNIPESGAAARPYPANAAVSASVQAGETMASIALKYGVTVHTLAVANGLADSAELYPGMVLSIPSAQAGSNSVRYASIGQGLCMEADPDQVGTGYFIRPTSGYILTQRFSPWHSGMDLAAVTGTQVYAADGGTVVFSGWNPAGYGNLIVLDHGNGWRTYYAHLSRIDVGCGSWIPRGSIIGAVGSTGNSTGPHLHFEMLRWGIAVNPAGYIRF